MKKYLLLIAILFFTSCSSNFQTNKKSTIKPIIQNRYKSAINSWKHSQFAKYAGVIISNNGEFWVKTGDKEAFDINFTFNNKKMNFLTFSKEFLPKVKNSKHFYKIYLVNLPNNQIGKLYVEKAVDAGEFFFAIFNKNQFQRKYKNIEVYEVKKGKISYPQVKGTKWDKKINEYLKKYPKNIYALNYRIFRLNDYQLNIVYRVIIHHKEFYKYYKPRYEEYYLLKRIYLHHNADIISTPVISTKGKIYIFDYPKKLQGYTVYQDYRIKYYRTGSKKNK